MVRCVEFYEKWRQDPEWRECTRSDASKSEIEKYLGIIDELEETHGIDRSFAIAKMSEGAARALPHPTKKESSLYGVDDVGFAEYKKKAFARIAEELHKEVPTLNADVVKTIADDEATKLIKKYEEARKHATAEEDAIKRAEWIKDNDEKIKKAKKDPIRRGVELGAAILKLCSAEKSYLMDSQYFYYLAPTESEYYLNVIKGLLEDESPSVNDIIGALDAAYTGKNSSAQRTIREARKLFVTDFNRDDYHYKNGWNPDGTPNEESVGSYQFASEHRKDWRKYAKSEPERLKKSKEVRALLEEALGCEPDKEAIEEIDTHLREIEKLVATKEPSEKELNKIHDKLRKEGNAKKEEDNIAYAKKERITQIRKDLFSFRDMRKEYGGGATTLAALEERIEKALEAAKSELDN